MAEYVERKLLAQVLRDHSRGVTVENRIELVGVVVIVIFGIAELRFMFI